MDKQTNSTSDWFYQINKQHVGPFSKDEMVDKFFNGKLDHSALLWRGGMSDWTPASKLSEFRHMFPDENIDNITLPSIPDLHEIEAEVKKELDSSIPAPDLKEVKEQKLKSVRGVIKRSNSKSRDSFYSSKVDRVTGNLINTQFLSENYPTVELPELPIDDVPPPISEIFKEQTPVQELKPVEEIIYTPEEKTQKRIKHLVALITVCFFVTLPLVYFLLRANNPVLETNNLSPEKKSELTSFLASNNEPSQIKLTLSSQKKLFGVFKDKGSYSFFAEFKSLPQSITRLKTLSGRVKGIINSNVISASYLAFENVEGDWPEAGIYNFNFKLEDTSTWGGFIKTLQGTGLFNWSSYVSEYQHELEITEKILLGVGSEKENLNRIREFKERRTSVISKPISHFKEQIETISSLSAKFEKIFFNATTRRRFSQSKIYFAHRYGREVAPIVQAFGVEDFNSLKIQKQKIGAELFEEFKTVFERIKQSAREISGVAAYSDRLFSKDEVWFSGKRIKERNLVRSELKKIKKSLRKASDKLRLLEKKHLTP